MCMQSWATVNFADFLDSKDKRVKEKDKKFMQEKKKKKKKEIV